MNYDYVDEEREREDGYIHLDHHKDGRIALQHGHVCAIVEKVAKSKISKINYMITIRNATAHIVCTSTRTHDQHSLPFPIHLRPMLTRMNNIPR